MANTLPYPLSKKRSAQPRKYGMIALLILLSSSYWAYQYVPPLQPDQLKMEKKSSGKNGKHANPDAQKSAESQYDKVKSAHDDLLSKANKTKEDVKELEKLKKVLKHWRKKKDWKGENHSQKSKGN